MEIKDKALLLSKVLQKHKPETVLKEAEQLMRNIDVLNAPDDVKARMMRVCAASMELYEVLK